MATLPELIFYAFVNYIPYSVLALYPFWNSLRFSKTKTVVCFHLYMILVIALFAIGHTLGGRWRFIFSDAVTLLCVLFYFLAVKARKGRMLFNLFMFKNIANTIVVVGKYLESVFFPTSVGTMCRWTDTVCMLILMVPLTPLVIHIMSKYFTKRIRDSISPTVWRYLWLIPVFFYGIWWFIYYFLTGGAPLRMAMTLESSVFMVFFLAGLLLISICIGKLVVLFNQKALLDEENHRLVEQSLQYKCINNHINEIRRIRHDLRHQAIVINTCLETEDYARIKELLQVYITSIPNMTLSYCSNTPLNMLLVYYAQQCEEQQIPFDVKLNLPSEMHIADSDIIILFGNALENAFDACAAADCSNRQISVRGSLLQNQFVFSVQNIYNGNLKKDKATNEFLSTKHAGSGIGISSMRSVVEKHHGTLRITTDNNTFDVSIFLPVEAAVA